MALTKVTGEFIDIGDIDISDVGTISLDAIQGDADANTSITFSGSDVITIATGGSGRLTIGDGALSPVTNNQIDLGTASLEFKNAFFDGTVTADAFAGPLTGDVTGNVSGTAATVTTAAQSAITSVGTLTGLTIGSASGATITMNDTDTNQEDFAFVLGANALAMRKTSNSNDIMRLDLTNERVGIGTASPSANLHIYSTADNAPHLLLENFQNADTDDAPVIELYLNDQTTGGIGDNTDVGVIRFTGDEKDGGTKETYAEIRGVAHDPGSGTGNKGNLSFFVQSAGSLAETMTLDENRVGIGTASPASLIDIIGSTGDQIRIQSSKTDNTTKTAGIVSTMYTNNTVSILHGSFANGTNTIFYGSNDTNHRGIQNHVFYVNAGYNATSSHTEAVRITKEGDFYIGTDTVQGQGGCTFDHGTRGINQTFNQSSHSDHNEFITFRNQNTQIGSITAPNSSSIAYNTSSDYRLKENVTYTWDATTRLKQLKPARFNWIADDTNTLEDGFLAHEVQTVVPNAITGTKDQMEDYVDDEGETQQRMLPQKIDHSKLVPLLVKTIQELEARIATLEG